MPRFVTDAEIERLVRLSSFDGPDAAREAGEDVDNLTVAQVLAIMTFREARNRGMNDETILKTFKSMRDEKALTSMPATSTMH